MLQKGVGWTTRRSSGPKRSFMDLDEGDPTRGAGSLLVVRPIGPVRPVVPIVPVRPVVPEGMEQVAPADPGLLVALRRCRVNGRRTLLHPLPRLRDTLRKAGARVENRRLYRRRAHDRRRDDDASGAPLKDATPRLLDSRVRGIRD